MVSIFLSSTFRGMENERDLIHQYVLPQVQDYAEKLGESVDIVDLRWGIDTSTLDSEDAMRKILTVCGEKIKECHACFIAMLGEHYGSVLDEKYKLSYPLRETLSNENNISITEYEICYRLNIDSNNINFLLRTDLTYIERQQEKLRNAVQKNFQDNIHYYQLSGDSNVFVDTVTHIICRSIDDYVAQHPTCLYYEYNARNSVAFLTPRKRYISDLSELLSSDSDLILLTGANGIGKRSIIYMTITQLNIPVIGVSGNNHMPMMGIEEVCQKLYGQLLYYLPSDSSYEMNGILSAENLRHLIVAYCQNADARLLFIIENIDSLIGQNWEHELLKFPIGISNKIKWCVTSSEPSHPIFLNMQGFKTATMPITFLSKAEKRETIIALFESKKKELPKSVIEEICRKNFSGYPQYLKILLDLMLHFNTDDIAWLSSVSKNASKSRGAVIAENMLQYIKSLPDEPEKLYSFLVRKMCAQVNQKLANLLLDCIGMTHQGLRVTDLKGIACSKPFNYSEREFYLAFMYLRQSLAIQNHERYFPLYPQEFSVQDHENTTSALIVWLNKLPKDDIVRTSELFLLYARVGDKGNFLLEMSRLSGFNSKHTSLIQRLFQEYEPFLFDIVTNIPTDDSTAIRAIMELCCAVCYRHIPQTDVDAVMRWLNALTESCVHLTSPIAIPYNLAVFRAASKFAQEHSFIEKQSEWVKVSEDYFHKLQAYRLPIDSEILTQASNVLTLNIKLMMDLPKARKCLSEGLSLVLCKYILDKTEETIAQLCELVESSDFAKIIADCSNSYHPISLHFELRGDLEMAQMHYHEAEESYRIGAQYAYIAKGEYSLNYTALLMKCAGVAKKTEQYSEAMSICQKVYRLLLEMGVDEKPDEVSSCLGLTLCHIGEIYSFQGQYETAYQYYIKGKNVFEDLCKRCPSFTNLQDYATTLFKLAELALTSGQHKEEGLECAGLAGLQLLSLSALTGEEAMHEKVEQCVRLYLLLGGNAL